MHMDAESDHRDSSPSPSRNDPLPQNGSGHAVGAVSYRNSFLVRNVSESPAQPFSHNRHLHRQRHLWNGFRVCFQNRTAIEQLVRIDLVLFQ